MAPPSPASPQQLLRALQSRDQQALGTLWREWAPKLQNFVRSQLAFSGLDVHSAAPEIVSDVFHDLWRHPERFDGRVAFSTWLYAIARNKSIDYRRRNGRRTTMEIPVDEDGWDDLPSATPSPEDALGRGQERAAVLNCLGRLKNALQREALMLWALEDMRLADIATAQQSPEGTVKTRLFHGRKNLRSCLEQSLSLEGTA